LNEVSGSSALSHRNVPATEQYCCNPAKTLHGASNVDIAQRADGNILRTVGIWQKGKIQTFGPTTVNINVGQAVTFANADVAMVHSVFGEKGEFASPMLNPGATFTTKPFDQKGVIHFQCAPHPWMKGTIIMR
jgi:plastocyanin